MTEAALSPECAAIMEGISAYLDGELERTECAAIERHCGGCARCAAVVEALQRTVGLCRGVANAPLPEHVRARAQESIRQLLGRDERH
jgi:anti-sigma factor RsiW